MIVVLQQWTRKHVRTVVLAVSVFVGSAMLIRGLIGL